MNEKTEIWTRKYNPSVQGNFVSWAEDDLILLTLGYAYPLRLEGTNVTSMCCAALNRDKYRDSPTGLLITAPHMKDLKPGEHYERKVKIISLGEIPKDITQILQREGFVPLRAAA